MSRLSVDEVIDEPLFTEEARVIRRKVVVNGDGVGVYSETSEGIMVIPTAGDGSTLDRGRDGGVVHHRQRFYTAAQLNPGLTGEDADRIEWGGRMYQVQAVGDWSRWGKGFVSAACVLIPPDGGARDDAAT